MILELLKANLSEATAKAVSGAWLFLKRVLEDDGVQAVCSVGTWGLNSSPGADVRATVTKAAVAGVSHVCTSISGAICTAAAAQAAVVSLILRDGASGVGPGLWSKSVILPVSGVFSIDLAPLNIVGTPGNAMTLEWTAVGAAGSVESCSLSGYDAS